MKKMMKTLLSAGILAVMVLAMGVMVSAASQVPGKVTGVKQTNAGNYSVSFSWDAQLMDCQYDTQISEDGKNWYNVDDQFYTAGTTEYVNNLSAGKTYYVRVSAVNKTDETHGPWSDTVAVVTQPLDLKDLYQTNATKNSMTLGWSKVEGATAYQIYQYINGEYILKGETSNTSFTISGLKNSGALPFTAIRVNPIRSAGTYKAIGYGKMLYSSSLRLISDKVKNVSIKYYWSSLKEINFGFNPALYADGYQYQLYDLNGKKPVSTGTTLSYYSTTVNNIKANRFYKLRVRAYVTVNGKKLYGDWSDFNGFAFQPKVSIKASGKNGFKLSWKKTKAAKSYTVYMSTSKDTGYKKIKTLKKTSLKVTKFKKKKLKKRKQYWFYVVANTKMGKKTVKSKGTLRYWATRY